jgi:hypothetical protein
MPGAPRWQVSLCKSIATQLLDAGAPLNKMSNFLDHEELRQRSICAGVALTAFLSFFSVAVRFDRMHQGGMILTLKLE